MAGSSFPVLQFSLACTPPLPSVLFLNPAVSPSVPSAGFFPLMELRAWVRSGEKDVGRAGAKESGPRWSQGEVATCVRAKSLRSCPTLCDPVDQSPPGSSVHGILQARILQWVTMPSSRGSSRPRDRTHSLLGLLHWQEGSLPLSPPGKPEVATRQIKSFFYEDPPSHCKSCAGCCSQEFLLLP